MNLAWGLLHAGLQTVLDTALDPVVVMDPGGMVIGWNALSADCFGWTGSACVMRQPLEKRFPCAVLEIFTGPAGGRPRRQATSELEPGGAFRPRVA